MDAELPYMGQIVPTAAYFAPQDWGLCSGELLPISQYNALFSLLGNMYGGSQTRGTFGLPNLNGRVGCGYGSPNPLNEAPLSVSKTFGQPAVQLTTANLPAHHHGVALTLGVGVDYTTGNGTQSVPPSGGLLANAILAGTTTTVDIYAPISASSPISATLPVTLTGTPTITAGPAGGGSWANTTPISVIQPTLVMYMCIALEGQYPVRQ